MHDGPGIRTTVFLKGCPLRCAWCHNPETQKSANELLFYQNKCIRCGGCAAVCIQNAHIIAESHFIDRKKCVVCGRCADVCPTGAPEICGRDMTANEILSVIKKDTAFYGDDGGVTISGGEPFAQGKATVELLKICKSAGVGTAVETCGYADKAILLDAAEYTDLFLWDIKDTDDERHIKYTGVSAKKIFDNLASVGSTGAKIRLRCILINGVNTDKRHYARIAEIAAGLPNCEGVEFIKYHAYAGTKAVFIGENDNANSAWIPSDDRVSEAKDVLNSRGVRVF